MEEAQLNLDLGVSNPVTMEELIASLDVHKKTIAEGSKRIVETALSQLHDKALKELTATWSQEAEDARRSADFLRTLCSKDDMDNPKTKDILAAAKEAMTVYLLKNTMVESLNSKVHPKASVDIKRRTGESRSEYHERLVMYLKDIQRGEDIGMSSEDLEARINQLKQSQKGWTNNTAKTQKA